MEVTMGANGNRKQTLRSNSTQPYNVGFLNETDSEQYNVAVYDELTKISTSTNQMFQALDDVNKEIDARTKALQALNLQVNSAMDKVWLELGNVKVELGKGITVNDIIGPDGEKLDGILEGIQTTINATNGKITTIQGEVISANTRIDGVITQVDTINGNVSQIIGEITDINGTIQTIQGQVSNAQSTASEALTVARDVDGKYTAQWEVKTSVDGLQGGVGFYNNGSTTNFTINANSLVFTNGSATAGTPFQISGGVTQIKAASIIDGSITNAKIANAAITTAKIADASITNAKITGVIQSNNYNGVVGWRIDSNGGSFFLGNQDGSGRVFLNGDGLSVYDAAGTLRVKVGRIS